MDGLSRHPLRVAIAAAFLWGALAATASAQEATPDRVSGRATGPGIEVGAPTAVSNAGGEGPTVTGPGQVILGVQAQQLPRTGGFAFEPGLTAAAGAALASLGFYFRSGRRARKG
jgi:hypothetical protein